VRPGWIQNRTSRHLKKPGKRQFHVVMAGNVLHVPALGEQIINFTKNGIINNLSHPALGHLFGSDDAMSLAMRFLQKKQIPWWHGTNKPARVGRG
jgi:hypothetical protein